MNAITLSTDAYRRALTDAVAGLVPRLQARAAALDEAAAFPAEDVADLHAAGLLLAPFPETFGGSGLGSSQSGARPLSLLLRLLGRGNLAVGRLFEAHVNAVRLLTLYGEPTQVARAAGDARAGSLFGLWVTDEPDDPVRVSADGQLHGAKAICSGAGHAGPVVVTVTGANDAVRLAYLTTANTSARPLASRPQGMRAAANGRVCFDGCSIGEDDWLGVPGDYLREPAFSAGAWRTSAVTCGGLEGLVEAAMRQLARRGRAGDPHQQARMGRLWIAQETALMWLARACDAAESDEAGLAVAETVATVNFARLAIEQACLESLVLVERSLGLAAFLQPDPIERIRRDLATYLRQPAGDEALTEAAAHILRTRMGGP